MDIPQPVKAAKMIMSKTFRQELRLENLGFNFEEPSYFVRSQWSRCGSYCFILYRLLLAGYFVLWLVWTCVKEAVIYHQHIFLYFTTWVAMVTALHSTVAALSTFYHHVIRTRPGRRGSGISRDVDFPMSVSTEPITLNADANGEVTQVNVITGVTIINPWYIRFMWFLYNIALTGCGILTLLYWPLVYDGNITDTKLCNNALNTLLLILDIMISRIPVRVLHVLYGATFCFVYVIFNILYCLYGTDHSEGPIYSVLDWWNRPMLPSAGVCVVLIVILPMVQFTWYLLYQLRLYLWRRYGQIG